MKIILVFIYSLLLVEARSQTAENSINCQELIMALKGVDTTVQKLIKKLDPSVAQKEKIILGYVTLKDERMIAIRSEAPNGYDTSKRVLNKDILEYKCEFKKRKMIRNNPDFAFKQLLIDSALVSINEKSISNIILFYQYNVTGEDIEEDKSDKRIVSLSPNVNYDDIHKEICKINETEFIYLSDLLIGYQVPGRSFLNFSTTLKLTPSAPRVEISKTN